MERALAELVERVRTAVHRRTPLCIHAGGTKVFYGNEPQGDVLDPRSVTGIVAYEPSELVITARAGTPLREIEAALAERGQMLAFEPPHYGMSATLGGCIASGIAGPRRASIGPSYGSVRDFVLGARLIDGRGQLLRFGGVVVKNVAGYDVARVLAGSLGILGVITEVSLKVLPRPMQECTLHFHLCEHEMRVRICDWSRKALPISASVWNEGSLFLRLSGAAAAVGSARARLGGTVLEQPEATAFWESIREQTHRFFTHPDVVPLWRVSLPAGVTSSPQPQSQLIEWGGTVRWLRTALPAESIRTWAREAGGHATLFRGGDRTTGAFTPLTPAMLKIHRRLKAVFDPAGIFNPGRMYPDL